jgi:asparagine synthase (glutamine-hydrolysing)
VPAVPFGDWLRRAYLTVTRTPQFPAKSIREIEDLLGGPNAWLNVYGLMGLSKLRFFSQDMWDRLDGHNPFTDLRLPRERMRKWHPVHRSLLIGGRVMLPGLLLASKGDRVAMNSSVETRYPFLDEEVFAFLAKLHPRWKLRGLRDKYLLRLLAERYLPREIAWRRKAMFRAPMDSFHFDEMAASPAGAWVNPLLSDDALRRTGYFNVEEVKKWRRDFRRLRPHSMKRTSIEMGLVGVTATQLWHHTYIQPLTDETRNGVHGTRNGKAAPSIPHSALRIPH